VTRRIALLLAVVLLAAAPRVPQNDFADPAFAGPLAAGLRAFYTRDFATAQERFSTALDERPANTFALAFLNATAAQTPGALDALIAREEDALAGRPNDALAHLRLGFSYVLAGEMGNDRTADARQEFETTERLDPAAAAPHVGLGILRESERSANRAKVEFLTALAADPTDVLAREYLGLIYQVDLKDPQHALSLMIAVPNVVPDYADIDFHLASVLYDLHQSKDAVAYATRALELDTGHVGEAGRYGYTLLARIYLDDKQLADARRVLHAAIAAGADPLYATSLLDRIDAGDYGK
jgi:tetratricopeptide (TPR) repeat protein